MRINKFLASCGLGSRRKVEELIIQGKITVNNEITRDLSLDITDADKVYFNDKLLELPKESVYIMLNKPKCYITSMKDEKDRRVVIDLLKGLKQKVFPVGRLDYNTQGLLLLTNDGDFANNIIHPSKHISKTYEVSTKYLLTNKQMNQIRRGIVIDEKRTLPAKIEFCNKDENYFYYHITIYEGRNREIRKMFEFLNVKIYSLKRLSIGGLELGDLPEGNYRYLNQSEIKKIFS